MRKLLRRIPGLMRLRIKQLQWRRRLRDLLKRTRFTRNQSDSMLPHVIKKHKSVLRRTLGQTDPQLQENKIVNLGLSIRKIDGVTIRPGETFSLWRLVGNPTAGKGYINGLTISHGEVRVGIGGGLCQLANMLFWLGLHTPLEIAERHHHSYDLFPDDRRTIPFGSGTTIYYNYLDLRFHNPTDLTFQFHLWLTDTFLEGEIRCDRQLSSRFKIEERNHRFEKQGEVWFRKNEIWRMVMDPVDGSVLEERLLIGNCSEVRYQVEEGSGNGS
jgi:vancomycin resistance protein VanW